MGSRESSHEAVVLRDRGVVLLGWIGGVAAAAGAGASAAAGSASGVIVLGAVAAWLLAGRVFDVPRVELHPHELVIRCFTTTVVRYDEIVGTHIDSRWWAGRSGLVLERGFDHVTPIPPGAGLGPPRWHLRLRDELNRRSPHDLV